MNESNNRDSISHPIFIFLVTLFYINFTLISFAGNNTSTKNRIIVTTDIGGTDPDDEESMVHLLMCANDLDIEGLICQMAFCQSPIGIETLSNILKAYEQAYPNLIVHDPNFPSYEYLYSIATTGQTKVGMNGVGENCDTPGSELIIKAVDLNDPRPIWLTAWGGMNTIAQAIWKVKHTRSETELREFLSKIRIYDILGQCDAGAWIAHNFPEVLYIRARDVYGWAPDDNWTCNNIQAYSPMGNVYPSRKWAIEGDSPSFLYLLDNGLNMPEDVASGGWGGRFNSVKNEAVRGMDWVERNNLNESQYDPYFMYTNPENEATMTRWSEHIRNDFAARIQWSCNDSFEKANHHPVILINDEIIPSHLPIIIKATPGKTISLDLKNSYDPDGDPLFHNVYLYKEASNYNREISICCNDQTYLFTIPQDSLESNLHIIIETTDKGTPTLTSYRRVIIEVLNLNEIGN